MAALECNNGQDGFSPTENGDAVSEDKSLNIDYTEDLWLANGEDSSGPYAQQPSKVMTVDVPCSYSEARNSCHDSFTAYRSIDSHSVDEVMKSEFSEPQTGNARASWSEVLQDDDENGGATLQPATSYLNGLVEENGAEFDSSGEEKDFAQLVPAGGFVENGGATGAENQDKTFTSLMPAAAMGVNEEIQSNYMIGSHDQQMVYYNSADQMNSDSASPLLSQNDGTISYNQSVQMVAVNREDSGSRGEGSNAVYISVDSGNSQGGNFTVLSPAMIRIAGDDQSYASHMSGGGYQHISTLPFVQNSAYSGQTSFASYHSAAAPAIIAGVDNQPQQVLQPSDYSSEDHASFCSSDGAAHATLTPSLQTSTMDYQEDEDEQDEDANQDLEDDSVEFSEFSCPVCHEGFLDQPTLDDHVSNHPPLKTFVCETCGKGFATRRYLNYHKKNHCKRPEPYEAQNDNDENDHIGGEMKKFSCNVCNRPFRVLKCMKVHKKKKHDIQKDFTCQNCAVTFSSSQELLDHPCELKSAPSIPQVVQYTLPALIVPSQKKKKKLKNARPCCDICGKTFSDRISVDIHRVKHIEEELYPCDMCCEHEETDGNHLAVHFRIRFFTDDNQHILEDQKAATTTNDQSRSDDGSSISATPVHNPGSATPQSAPATPVHHPPTPSHPPETPVSAVNGASDIAVQLLGKQNGSDHLLNQTDFEQTYINISDAPIQEGTETFSLPNQNTCRRATDESGLIKQESESQQLHVYNPNFSEGEVIHDASGSVMAVTPKKKKLKSSKIHTCDICNKSFGDSTKLELHYKCNHLNDRPYQCDVCEKSFFTKWKLQRHMLSHLEQKPHSCPMCSKSFVERGKLEAHYRTHLGTKPYKCDQCSKTFTVKSQLSIHQRRIHSTDQPFGCLVCGKAFLWKSGLDKHMRKHTREKPYICASCGMKYTNKANLVVHMSKAHNQTYTDKQST